MSLRTRHSATVEEREIVKDFVQENEVLYRTDNKDYANREVTMPLWQELAGIPKISGIRLKLPQRNVGSLKWFLTDATTCMCDGEFLVTLTFFQGR